MNCGLGDGVGVLEHGEIVTGGTGPRKELAEYSEGVNKC